jgi:hypothetical protein
MALPSPPLDHSLLIRTDFADDAAWIALCDRLEQPVDDLSATLFCVSDRAYEGLTPADVARLVADQEEIMVVFLADAEAIGGADQAVLVVDPEEPGRAFRVAPDQLASVQANLEIGNMDVEEFADAVDEGGVFRGF